MTQVVIKALSKPRAISKKTAGHEDIVTETDKTAEIAITSAILAGVFPIHITADHVG